MQGKIALKFVISGSGYMPSISNGQWQDNVSYSNPKNRTIISWNMLSQSNRTPHTKNSSKLGGKSFKSCTFARAPLLFIFEVNVQETNIRIARNCTMKFRWCISYTIFPTTWRLWTSYSFRLPESHQNHKNLLILRENKFLWESGAQGHIPVGGDLWVSWEVLSMFVLKAYWVRID